MRPVRGKIWIKSLWKGGSGDDSPWDGEMSEGQRGQVPVRETFPQKGFPPIKSIRYYIRTEVVSVLFHALCKVGFDLLLDDLCLCTGRCFSCNVGLDLGLGA